MKSGVCMENVDRFGWQIAIAEANGGSYMLVQFYSNSSLVLPLTGYSVTWFKVLTQKNMNLTLQIAQKKAYYLAS